MADPSKRPDETARSGEQEPGSRPPASGPAPASGPQQEQRVPVNIDESRLTAVYSNFCRVTGTPEEVILDFAVTPSRSRSRRSRSRSPSGSSSAR